MQRIHSRTQFPYFNINTGLLIDELLRRGIELWLIDETRNVLMARLGDHVEFLCDIQSQKTPFSSFQIASHNGYTKQALSNAGFSVPEGLTFSYQDVPNALVYAQRLGF